MRPCGHPCPRGHGCPPGRECVRADAPCFILGNFKKDATVHPSHRRPRGHRPFVRPSENVRVTAMRSAAVATQSQVPMQMGEWRK
jgi:hypothetical protein